MKISYLKQKSKLFKEFEESEWRAADLEHFGHEIDFNYEKYYLKASDNNRITGILVFSIKCGVCTIKDLLIDHGLKGLGIGTALLKEAERKATEKGAHKITLITGKGWKAEGFYQKFGYKQTGVRENDL